MKNIALILTFISSLSAFASESQLDLLHPCANEVIKIGAKQMLQDLNQHDLDQAEVRVLELGFRYSLESYPTQEVFDIKLTAQQPGSATYEVVVSGDSCKQLSVTLIDEE